MPPSAPNSMLFSNPQLDYWQVVALVLFAALLHATWNAVIKDSPDKSESFLGILLHGSVPILPLWFFIPLPPPELWGIIALNMMVLVGYYITLTNVYRVGDFGYSYPIIRGVSPLIVTLYAYVFMGETLAPLALVGVIVVAVGILANVLEDGYKNINATALKWAIGCGICTSLFAAVGGTGSRMAVSPFHYIVYIITLESITMSIWGGIKYGRPFYGRIIFNRNYMIGGWASTITISIILFAMTQTQLGIVTALRETSSIFGAIIAYFVFKEALSKRRIITASIVCVGIALIILA